MTRDKQEVDEVTECPECRSDHLTRDYNRGELVCKSCGLVIDDNFIDQGPEWRAFDAEQTEKRSRTGAPMTVMIHDKGLSTEMGWGARDAFGKNVPSKNRAQLYRMRKWQNRTRQSDSSHRNLALALNDINQISSKLGLHRNVRESAASLYRQVVKKNLNRGRSVEAMSTAVLYAACRQCNVPRTMDEIAKVTNISKKEISRCYRHLSRELKLKLAPTSPIAYVSRFCSELELGGDVQSKVVEILNQATAKQITAGRGPLGLAGAAIYIATVLCNERKTQKEIAEALNVTEVTIRNRYRELADNLNIDLAL